MNNKDKDLLETAYYVLRYVDEETNINDYGDWVLGYGYDPNLVSDLLGKLDKHFSKENVKGV